MDQASRLRELVNLNSKAQNSFKVITVASGKGGVGKTNFVVNLAAALSSKGQRVAILDADFGMANVDILYGVKCRHSIYDIMYNGLGIKDIISSTAEGIKIIPGGSGIKELSEINDEKRQKLINEFSNLDNIDILIVDTGAGMSNNVTSFIEIADDIIIITNSEPTALTDAYSLIKVMSKSLSLGNMNIIINRVGTIQEAHETFEKLYKTADAFLNIKLKYLGHLNEDQRVGQAVKNQKPFYIMYPRSSAALCIDSIASKLTGDNRPVKNKSFKDYFGKLLNLMGR